MKPNALGMAELRTVATGMRAADLIVKTAETELILAQTVCPGKYIILFSGELSAVKASLEACQNSYSDAVIDTFILGNPHPQIYSAFSQTCDIEKIEALGVIETFTSSACVVAGDCVLKAADVRLIEIRLARGMCGKSYVLFTGSVANVEEASEIALKNIGETSNAVDYAVIPRPDERFWKMLM